MILLSQLSRATFIILIKHIFCLTHYVYIKYSVTKVVGENMSYEEF